MKKSLITTYLLVAAVGSVGAVADMTVDKSDGGLMITSSISGTVVAKVIGPNDEVVVDRKYEGNSFSWTPSGADGAYRYDVRVTPQAESEEAVVEAATMIATLKSSDFQSVVEKMSGAKSDYAGGSVEIKDGQMMIDSEEKE